MNFIQRVLHRPFFIKLFHWEYWPFNVVYAPIIFVWFWFCLRARSLFFFSASNPTIQNGGFLMESKMSIYDLIPQQYFPRTLFFPLHTAAEIVVASVREAQLKYPLIGKPDMGGRGRGVKKLDDEIALKEYAKTSPLDFLVQEFIPFELEVGIFYYRYPGDTSGKISGIVRKEFLSVVGDGHSSIEELLNKEKRFILQIETLQKTYGPSLQEVLPVNEIRELVPYGNHARGAMFLDDSHLVDAQLTASIDAVCKQIKGFYYGRMDVRYASWEDLRNGRNFGIVEVNGAGSEPTHMYDPKHSIFFAWKEIIRHWNILRKISLLNHRKGIPYLSYKDGVAMMRENAVLEKKLDELYD